MHLTFGAPWFLLLLPLALCFRLCPPEAARFYFSKTEWLGRRLQIFSRQFLLDMLFFSLLIFALADPFVYEKHAVNTRKGRDLVLVLDASGSMAQRGFDGRDASKFDTLLLLAQHFIARRGDDNVGVVLFGTFAYTAVPLTYDRRALHYLLGTLTTGLAGESTAIGDALMQALRTLDAGDAKRKAIVLFTDGRHNAGAHSPKEAVKAAQKAGVRIYTVGIGETRDYDAALLTRIASETEAKSFGAKDADALEAVFSELDTLEPSPIRSERYLGKRSLVWLAVLAALTLLALRLQNERERQ